jgi:uncharacterized membrane protein YdjX (TVP38/TMEM64 family)/rhodanese-related sulfurtransferase/sulfur relay (sulfurtransferase) complex TusBCD TusD component (DsrE family)
MKTATGVRLLLLAVLVAAIGVAVYYRSALSTQALEIWVQQFGAAGPLIFMAIYAFGTVLFFPGSVLTLAGGALFGPVWGTFYNLTGATLGATLAFLIARYLASDWVARKASGWMKQLIDGVEKEGWHFVAFVRLMPLFPFNLLNYALGITRISLLHYVVASYLFMLPGALAYTYLGYAGREAIAGGEGLIQKSLLALALLGLVAFLPRLIKRLRGSTAVGKLSTAELKQRLDRHDEILVLDVRAARDYAGASGHIPNAKSIPLDELPRRLTEIESHRDRPLAVICRTNRMSGKAVSLLRTAGFQQALLVDDGMVGWERQGFATDKADARDPSPAPDVCGATPNTASAGTGKTIAIIIQNAPYKGDNKAWHALRFAGAALAEDMKVRVHLLDDGAQLARHTQTVPEGAVDLGKLLVELMEYGLEVRACGMALNDCKLDERDLLPGIQQGSMKALAGWVKDSDIVLTF